MQSQATTGFYNSLISLATAEAFLLLVRAKQILVLARSNVQRDEVEREEVRRGLTRSLILEVLVFVPASVFLVLILIGPLFMRLSFVSALLSSRDTAQACWGLLGLVSYGFPWLAVRSTVRALALSTLRNFAMIALQPSGPGGRDERL